jgi:hypothetical protein
VFKVTVPVADPVRGHRSGDPPCSAIGTTGRVLLAKWSFHTPRQQAGQASTNEPPPE